MKKLFAIIISTIYLFAITPLEVAKKSDEVSSNFDSSVAIMHMTLINASGQKSDRTMELKTLEGANGDKSLMSFLTPADVKGTKLLTYEKIDDEDDQWLYMPALKRTKRISSSNKSGSFMGSEFSYEDVANNDYRKYTYQEGLEEVMLDGVVCFKFTRVPKDTNSGYSKQIIWVEKENFLVQKVEYYDRKNELLKVAVFGEYKKLDEVWRIGKIHMKNLQNKKETVLLWSEDKVKADLNQNDFRQSVLSR
ncbi:MAG: outer membrane lipoprotein-sorting protein [Campylobacterales bacterium]|nr:outer membrane lipoprotein-sorting protein [Campylobacterales bacterium]